jgi:hypothetical protein
MDGCASLRFQSGILVVTLFHAKQNYTVYMKVSLELAALCMLLFPAPTKAADKPFEWQWHKMDDDFWQRPILRQMKIKNDDRVAIIDAVAKSLKTDREDFSGLGSAELYDLVSNESYEWADLDSDGAPELITMTFGVDTCGAVGNCLLQVFRRHGTSFELILSTEAQSLMVDRSGPKPLLVLYTHESAVNGNLAVYDVPKNDKAKLVHHYGVRWARLDGTAFSRPHLDVLPVAH